MLPISKDTKSILYKSLTKAVSIFAALCFLINEIAFAAVPTPFKADTQTLAPASKFSFFLQDGPKSELAAEFRNETVLIYISRLIGKALAANGSIISVNGLRELIRSHLTKAGIKGENLKKIDLDGLKKEGAAFILQVTRNGGEKETHKFYLSKDKPVVVSGEKAVPIDEVGTVTLVIQKQAPAFLPSPELIHVLDPVTGESTGIAKTKKQVHEDGDTHASSIILIFDSEGRFLRQKRSARVSTGRGKFDVSTVGHLASGENYLQCAIREVGEELGIYPAERDLSRIGAEGGYRSRENEISTVYVYFKPDEVQVTPDPVDVESVDWIELRELRADYGKRGRAYYSSAISDICDNKEFFAEIVRLVENSVKPSGGHERPKFQGSPYAVALVLASHKNPVTAEELIEETKKAESTIKQDIAVLKKSGFAIEDELGSYLVSPNLSPAKVTRMLDVLREEYAPGQIAKKRGNGETKFVIERLKEIESFDAERILFIFGSDVKGIEKAINKMIKESTLEEFREVVNAKVRGIREKEAIIKLIDEHLKKVRAAGFRERHIRALNAPIARQNDKSLIRSAPKPEKKIQPQKEIPPQRKIPPQTKKYEPPTDAEGDGIKRAMRDEKELPILKRFAQGMIRWSETTEEERMYMIKKLAELCGKEPGALMSFDFRREFPQFGNKLLISLLSWYMKRGDLLNPEIALKWIKQNVLRIKDLTNGREIGKDQLANYFSRGAMPPMSRVTKEAKLYMLEVLAGHLKKGVTELELGDFYTAIPEFNNLKLSRMIEWSAVQFGATGKKSSVKAILNYLGVAKPALLNPAAPPSEGAGAIKSARKSMRQKPIRSEKEEPVNVDEGKTINNAAQEVIDTILIQGIEPKPEESPTIIALDTGWIKGYERANPERYVSINKLIVAIRRFCGSRGMVFVNGTGEELVVRIDKERRQNSKVVILADEKKLREQDAFAKFRSDEKALLVGVDNSSLTEEDYQYIAEMLNLALKIAFGRETGGKYPNIRIEKDSRISNLFLRIPKAEPFAGSAIERYAAQEKVFRSAA